MVLFQPCRTTAAYEALPESDLGLDLDEVERRLVADGWRTVVNARVMLVVAKDEEATVYPSGKVLIKTRERDVARRVWTALEAHLVPLEASDGS